MTQLSPTSTRTPEESLALFHQRRDLSVTQPKGNLALISTDWVTGDPTVGHTVWGVPGTWYPQPAGESGLRLVASASDGITVNGQLVDGEIGVYAKDDPEPSELSFSDTLTGTIITNDENTEYGVRLWDANSDAIQRFGTISSFPYNPEWVISASFTPVEGLSVGFVHQKDNGAERDLAIPGEITFEKDGVAYNLAAFKSGRALQLVFGDSTNGTETYSVGRFLFVAPNDDGTITLDFNNAVLPPCAFSYAFNCPIPPKQNRFEVPIEAGEKQVLTRDGSLLHE